MSTENFIQNFRRKKAIDRLQYRETEKSYMVAGMPLVKCRDALLISGKNKGQRLSDIFIFDPNYMHDLLSYKGVDADLKDIINEVERNQSHGKERVARRLALGH